MFEKIERETMKSKKLSGRLKTGSKIRAVLMAENREGKCERGNVRRLSANLKILYKNGNLLRKTDFAFIDIYGVTTELLTFR